MSGSDTRTALRREATAEAERVPEGKGKADGNSLAGLDFEAIIAEHKRLATAARRQAVTA